MPTCEAGFENILNPLTAMDEATTRNVCLDRCGHLASGVPRCCEWLGSFYTVDYGAIENATVPFEIDPCFPVPGYAHLRSFPYTNMLAKKLQHPDCRVAAGHNAKNHIRHVVALTP